MAQSSIRCQLNEPYCPTTTGHDGRRLDFAKPLDYGSKAGGGLQTAVRDIDNDDDMDIVGSGKSSLFLAENLTSKSPR
jgi:hypothetical protein